MGNKRVGLGDNHYRRLRSSNETTLAVYAQEGDLEAANLLYLKVVPHARSIAARGFRGVPDDVRDGLIGDVFIACIRPGAFQHQRGPFIPFFRSAMKNKLISWKRSHPVRDEVALDGLLAHERDAVEYQMSGRECDDTSAANLRDVVHALCEEWRSSRKRTVEKQRWARVAELRFCDGLQASQVAEALGISEKAVQNVLNRHVNPAITESIAPQP